MAKKKQQPKKEVSSEAARAEANGRIAAFNEEVTKLAEKYEVRLDITQRIVVVDAKPTQ